MFINQGCAGIRTCNSSDGVVDKLTSSSMLDTKTFLRHNIFSISLDLKYFIFKLWSQIANILENPRWLYFLMESNIRTAWYCKCYQWDTRGTGYMKGSRGYQGKRLNVSGPTIQWMSMSKPPPDIDIRFHNVVQLAYCFSTTMHHLLDN